MAPPKLFWQPVEKKFSFMGLSPCRNTKQTDHPPFIYTHILATRQTHKHQVSYVVILYTAIGFWKLFFSFFLSYLIVNTIVVWYSRYTFINKVN